jgi:DNA-binding response OmpR family regulator
VLNGILGSRYPGLARGTDMAHILLIEQDEHSADIITRTLTHHGHQVQYTGEGLTGVSLASQHHFDLVLLELDLPDVRGFTAAALIKRLSSELPVVAVTYQTDSTTQHQARAYGIDDLIPKPIEPRIFPDQLAEYLLPG